MRATAGLLVSLLLATGASACGSDSNGAAAGDSSTTGSTGGMAGSPAGAGGGGGTAGAGGLGPLGFDWPEGGEIRVEYVKTADSELSRGIAFFKSDQTPEATLFPALALSAESVCNDLIATPMWPTAPATATFLDVGDLSITGGGKTFSFTKQTNWSDFLGRPLGIAYTLTDAATMVDPSTMYDVVLGGSSSVAPGTWPASLGVPAAFQLVPKDVPASIVIPAGQDLPITWEQAQQVIPQPVLGLVAFENGNGQLTTLCITRDVTSTFVVPKSTVSKLAATGTLIRGQTTHHLREYPQGRRIDLIGTWCYATPYTLQ